MDAFLSWYSQKEKDYQFGITGLLLESPSRVTKYLQPTISIIDSRLVIVGPPSTANGVSDPFFILLKPFRGGAWILLGSMMALFFAFGVLIVCVFAPHEFGWTTLFFHIMGEPVDESVRPSTATTPNASADPSQSTTTSSVVSNLRQAANNFVRRRRESIRDSVSDVWSNIDVENGEENDDSNGKMARYRAALWLFRVSITMFVLIFILFYEIAVVNFMFMQNNTPLALNIERLSKPELSEYTILKSSGIEDIWRKIGKLRCFLTS